MLVAKLKELCEEYGSVKQCAAVIGIGEAAEVAFIDRVEYHQGRQNPRERT